MSISIDEVRHVARLARLELDETEMLSLQSELNALLVHFSDIRSLDLSGFAPISHANSLWNVWSEDEPGPTLPREVALRNAPMSKAGLFVVPMILED